MTRRTTPIFQVDAFTSAPFRGNPAAVCPLESPAETSWMQSVAAEMNLSETAFAYPSGQGFGLRWFTPIVEAKLCGHATLATAHVLWEHGIVAPEAALRFDTSSGALGARPLDGEIELDFPADPPARARAPEGLVEALGARAERVSRGNIGWVVELEDAATVRALQPDMRALRVFDGALVTAPGDDPQFDFVSRYFAPGAGIDEDPVTGSAHCALAPYWSDRFGRVELVGYQASVRGGVVGVALDGDRVRLRGRAVTVMRGELLA